MFTMTKDTQTTIAGIVGAVALLAQWILGSFFNYKLDIGADVLNAIAILAGIFVAWKVGKEGNNANTLKMIIAGVIVLLSMAGTVQAAPFLTADAYPATEVQPTYFKIFMDGLPPVNSPALTVGGTSMVLWYDLSSLAPGKHNVKAQACTELECSVDSDPFDFPLGAPKKPTNIRFGVGLTP